MSLCNPPGCRRHVGHGGDCRPTYHAGKAVCGVWMPQAREGCGRMAGHGSEHRSRWAMDHELRRPPEPFTPPSWSLLGPVPCSACRAPVCLGHSEASRREHTSAIWRNADGRRHVCRR